MSPAVAAIRAATSTDAAEVTRIVQDAYRHYIARIGRRPAPMLDDYGELISRDAVWVMEKGGGIVGIVVLLPKPDHLLIDNIAVSPERRGAGSGRKLLAFAEAEAIKRSFSEIRLYTHVKMVENQRLYASIGYEQTEVRVEQGFERVFMHKRLLDDPATVVRKQLDAYNARDIEAFMACWAHDAEIFEHPSILLASGAAAIRERHIARFKEPDLHGHLVHRMVVGNKVIDQEIVTRNLADGTGRVEVIAIYDVERGKIARAWFIFGPPTRMNK